MNKKFKIIIAGGRDFTNWYQLHCQVAHILSLKFEWDSLDEIEIVSGGARGVDKLGEKFAKIYDIDLKIFPAKWNEHGKSAGFIRNNDMAKYASALIAFWNGKSKGTKHMIDTARKNNLETHIIKY
jgi:hypothetical protein